MRQVCLGLLAAEQVWLETLEPLTLPETRTEAKRSTAIECVDVVESDRLKGTIADRSFRKRQVDHSQKMLVVAGLAF